jgi:urease accessory protein
MTALKKLLEQRSVGHVKLHMGVDGPIDLREAGAAKLRLPRGSREAILINVGGGLAGGDDFKFDISCANNAQLTVTTQAAERVYRSLGPAAMIKTNISVGNLSAVHWLPNETILYDGASLRRSYTVNLQQHSRFLALEPLLFGRTETGETIDSILLHDSWRINRAGRLIHAEEFRLGPKLPRSKSTLGNALAMATIIYLAEDAERLLERVRLVLDEKSAASAWNGKLIARVIAADGFLLRKALIPVMNMLASRETLPKNWTM